MIEAIALSVELRGRGALNNVGVALKPGEFLSVVGPNGAGKTTLLRAFAGLVEPSSGEVRLDGRPLSEATSTERARRIAYLPQEREAAWAVSVEDVAALGRHPWGGGAYRALPPGQRKIVDLALDKTNAAELRGRPLTQLSGGERARAHLARALAVEAAHLLLDEPCAGLDPRHQIDVMGALARECADGRAVAVVLHDLALAAQWCDRILVLDRGAVVQDAAPDRALDAETLRRVFGVRRIEDGRYAPAER
ncbi:MAG: ABC transporter ATP-binding protein [Pseudomonadota bacterium]